MFLLDIMIFTYDGMLFIPILKIKENVWLIVLAKHETESIIVRLNNISYESVGGVCFICVSYVDLQYCESVSSLSKPFPDTCEAESVLSGGFSEQTNTVW